jgi:PIN domain nuclease of toxin-antitoxin system
MQRLLLDTNAFLWWVDDALELSTTARRVIATADNECFLSMASCWEMAVKSSLGKLKLKKPVMHFVQDQIASNDFRLLNIDLRHVSKVEAMPFHHRDPFDRLLIAQAVSEKLSIVSSDTIFSEYGVKIVW